MKEMKKSVVNGLKKDLRTDDKLEKLVIDYAIRRTTGSRKDLDGVYYSKNGRHLLMASKSLSDGYAVCEGVREIDADAFWGCAYLEKLTLPDGIENIGHEAFGKCISLREINIPKSVKKIGVNPFIGIHNIHIISLSEAVVCNGKAVFTDHGKTLVSFVSDEKEYIVPEGVECIGEKAFSGKRQLQRVVLPQSLKVIDDEAFFDCDRLTSIVIPEKTEFIGDCAFGDCLALRSVCFNGIPKKMKRTMFAGCEDIRNITIPKDSTGKFKKLTRDFDDRVVEKATAVSPQKPEPTENSKSSKLSEKSEKSKKSEKSELSKLPELSKLSKKSEKSQNKNIPPIYRKK